MKDLLQVGIGSVVQLDKSSSDPIDIFVNQKLVARGEIPGPGGLRKTLGPVCQRKTLGPGGQRKRPLALVARGRDPWPR